MIAVISVNSILYLIVGLQFVIYSINLIKCGNQKILSIITKFLYGYFKETILIL